MVRLPAGNGPSIRLCARAWWISVLSSVQVNRFTCASRKVPLLWGSEGFSKDFKESSESKGAHPSSQPESSNGAVSKMPSPTGDRGFESVSLRYIR
jgi:hypothetical protein